MNLNQPERNVIIFFEPGDDLFSIAGACIGDEGRLAHAHDPAALESIVKAEAYSIALIIASDETAPYDTLKVMEAYKDEPWFAGALSILVAQVRNPAREEIAYAMGIQDYIPLSAASSIEREAFLRYCISHELRLTQRLQRFRAYAYCDGLTGLYNHSASEHIVTQMLHQHPGQEFLFAIIDIDYFKQANDVRGHEFGDAVLMEESRRLQQLLDGQSLAIRYGGDEFVLLLPIVSDPAAMARTIYEEVRFMLQDYQITNSIGIATTSSADRSWEALFRQADQALYSAKANGRNQYCIYQEEMSCQLDGAAKEIRNETLNLGTSPLIHALVNSHSMAFHLDLEKVAITRLTKTASGEYGWSDPIEYLPFIKNLLELVPDSSRLRFSEFINPNTLASRLKTAPTLSYFFTGVDERRYRVEYLAGDTDQGGQVTNALMLLREAHPSESESTAPEDDVTAIEKCLSSGMTDTYNAIWIIHPTTLAREIVSIQTDISRHRRINSLFEGGNYWQDTQGYVQLFVNEDEREALLRALHPDVVFREVDDKGIYTLYFHRRIDGITHRCEYSFINALYGEEKVVIQLYRRVK